MTSKAGGNADDLVSSQLSLSPSYLPQLRPLRFYSLSHMNTLLISPFTAVTFFLLH